MANVMTWQTWKKANNPEIMVVHDSTFGTAETRRPTLKRYFNKFREVDLLDEKRKPRQVLKEDCQDILLEATQVVYYVTVPTGAKAGYYKYLEIYWN